MCKYMTVGQIEKATGGKAYNITDKNIKITKVSSDSRDIPKGCLFIAIKGERFDGHEFSTKAIEQGASLVISEKQLESNIPYIFVGSTRQALLDIASLWRGLFDIPVIAITGSVGKTTTKEMIACVMSEKYKNLKTQKNLNNEIGMPQTLLQLDESYESAVIEMGMNHKGEISRMSNSCHPTIAVITNVGYSHIENLGSREGILNAKLEMLEGLKDGGTLVLNGDDENLSKVKSDKFNIVFYAIDNLDNASVYAKDIVLNEDSVEFLICNKNNNIELSCKLNCGGIHNVKNALAAYCVGVSAGVEQDKIVSALAKFKPDALRQNKQKVDDNIFILDCYNAAPDSMNSALQVLSNTTSNRRIAVLGGMLELGGYSQFLHEAVGKMVADGRVDYLLTFGGDSHFYVKSAVENGFDKSKAKEFQTREELAEFLKNLLCSGDTVLFKGSRGMKLELVAEQLGAKF